MSRIRSLTLITGLALLTAWRASATMLVTCDAKVAGETYSCKTSISGVTGVGEVKLEPEARYDLAQDCDLGGTEFVVKNTTAAQTTESFGGSYAVAAIVRSGAKPVAQASDFFDFSFASVNTRVEAANETGSIVCTIQNETAKNKK